MLHRAMFYRALVLSCAVMSWPAALYAQKTVTIQVNAPPNGVVVKPQIIEVRPGDTVTWNTDPKAQKIQVFFLQSPFQENTFGSLSDSVTSTPVIVKEGTFTYRVFFTLEDGTSVTASGSVKVINDVTPPTCTKARGPASDPGDSTKLSVDFLIKDEGVGLSNPILDVQAVCLNAEFSLVDAKGKTSFGGECPAEIGGFSSGVSQITLRVRQVHSSLVTRGQIIACDTLDNCTECDPASNVIRSTGRPVRQMFLGIPQEEQFVTVRNGSPGLRNLQVWVNGERFRLKRLRDGEEQTLDVSSAMLPGDANVFVVTANGRPGASAMVLIWDGR
jgi:plastocyanin